MPPHLLPVIIAAAEFQKKNTPLQADAQSSDRAHSTAAAFPFNRVYACIDVLEEKQCNDCDEGTGAAIEFL